MNVFVLILRGQVCLSCISLMRMTLIINDVRKLDFSRKRYIKIGRKEIKSNERKITAK